MKRIFINTVMSLFFVISGISNADQSLSIAFSKSENYFDTANKRYDYEPLTGSIYYSAGINDQWHIGASYWRSAKEFELDSGQYHFEDSSYGGGLTLHYLQGNWSFNVAVNAAKNQIDVRSPIALSFYEEEGESSDLNLSIDYVAAYDRFDILPSFGLGTQRLKQNSNGLILPTIFSLDEEQSGTYTFADLVLNTWFELNQHALVQTSVQLGWTEPLSGESSQISRSARRNGPLRQNSLDSDVDTEGAGYWGLSLVLFLDDVQLSLSHSRTLALDVNTDTSAVEIGVIF